jgi:hypothetical protein
MGVVIDTKISKGTTGPPSYTLWEATHAVVRYTDRNGQDHTATVGPDRPPGAHFPIVHSPRHPARCASRRRQIRPGLRCHVLILGLLAAFFIT